MLNEKITITICGKPYRLRTDNSRQLISMGEEIERRITEYCQSASMSKDDAAVFAALDLISDIYALRGEKDKLSKRITALEKGEAAAAAAVEENSRLNFENEVLKKDSEELAKLKKRFIELEGKNSQLADTLKEANERAAEGSRAKNSLEAAEKRVKSLEEKNAQLSDSAKENSAKLSEKDKIIAGLGTEITELKKQAERVSSAEKENKRLSDKLEKAQNTEEAYRRSLDEIEKLKKENKALSEMIQSQEGDAIPTGELEELKKLLEEAEAKVTDYEDLMVMLSELESENNALRERGGKPEQELAELKESLAEAEKEIEELRRINESLNKQVNEMLEDGQLTL